MKVLIVHNRYRTSAPSGEDIVVRNEQRMLEHAGAQVVTFDRCNDDLDDSNLVSKAVMAANTIWSQRSRSELRRLMRQARPDIVHVHNTFSMISPSIYGVAREAGAAVVQTLHNFRFFCPSALFLRDGRPCEECVDKSLLRSIRYRCYRNSLPATSTLAAMLALHRALGTYSRYVDRYIALTEFSRAKVARTGIPLDKISVKPNFLPDPPPAGSGGGGYVVFVGRLLEGKGTETLLRAWRELPGIRLKIVGDGALREKLEATARTESLNVEFAGRLDRAAVLGAIQQADCMVIPSEWYEGFPMVVAESFACGTPVLASAIGSLDELVVDGVTGYKFAAASPDQLANAVRRALSDPANLGRMRRQARAFFDAQLTEPQNYARLMSIYEAVLSRAEPAP